MQVFAIEYRGEGSLVPRRDLARLSANELAREDIEAARVRQLEALPRRSSIYIEGESPARGMDIRSSLCSR
jgi:hypothetical protein